LVVGLLWLYLPCKTTLPQRFMIAV